VIERGEIWWADLGEPRGSSPALRRPVLVVQSDAYTQSRLRTVVVVALTTNLRLASMPGNVPIMSSPDGLDHDSVVNVTQMATIGRDDLVERIGQVDHWTLHEVEVGLRRVLDL
jgi:mRNA interferase MazF